MKALRFHGQKDIRLEEVEIPKCGKGQVKVSVVLLVTQKQSSALHNR